MCLHVFYKLRYARCCRTLIADERITQGFANEWKLFEFFL
jgi:hypothetical protein